MRHSPIDAGLMKTRAIGRDALVAVAIGLLLSAAWVLAGWTELKLLNLPDSDDMMRLAQVRDWIAGQALNDWTQYRLGPPGGAPMHWSRVNDLGPAALILALDPLLGRHGAEVGAVIAYPAALFCLHLFLSARIARRLWGPAAAPIATVLAAFALPATSLFAPGRIDHHALQILAIEAAVLALMRGPGARNGCLLGLCFAVSLLIGLETAPQLAALAGVVFALWVARGTAERERLAGFGSALGAVTGLALLWLRPTVWSAAFCDAFTPASASITMTSAVAALVLAAATPVLRDSHARLGAGLVLGMAVLGAAVAGFPACLDGPYGVMHPFLRVHLIPNINEARGLFAQSDPARAVGLAGLVVAGSATAIWMVARRPRSWPVTAPVAAVIIVSALMMVAQVRGGSIGTALAGPVMAGLVLAARNRVSLRAAAVAAAWMVSSGFMYFVVPDAIKRWTGPAEPERAAGPANRCGAGDVWLQVDRYPPGVTMTAVDTAARLIGSTRHSSVAASYHRNDRGNMAMYRFFLSAPDASAAIARAWRVDYVAFCPGDFSEVDVVRRYPDSLGAMLNAGRDPPGFRRLPLRGTPLRFYRVEH